MVRVISKRNPLILLLVYLLIGIMPCLLHAQVRGKISGKVTDSKTGEPLPFANVVVKGTNLGAAADAVGEYFILNLPPGAYRVEARFMGYNPMVVEDVRVTVNHNTRVDFKLAPTAVEGEAVTVTAQRAELELVKMDLPTAELVLNMKEIVEVPADDMVAFLSLQPGIEFIEGIGSAHLPASQEIFGDDHTNAMAAQGISIRGGESRETLVLLDGMPLMNEHEDVSYFEFSKTASEAMEILTGGLSAEYGNAASGVVNVVTRESTVEYQFNFDVRYSPKALKHFGPSIHDQTNPMWETLGSEKSITGEGTPWPFPGGWTQVAKDPPVDGVYHPEAYRQLWRHTHRMTRPYAHEPDWEIDGTLSGFLPILNRPTFLISQRTKKNMLIYPSMDRPYYLHNNTYMKLGSNLSKSMKLYLMGMYGETKTMCAGNVFGYRAYLTGDPQNFSSLTFARDAFNQPTYNTRDAFKAYSSVVFTHTISPRTYYKVQATYQQSSWEQTHPKWRTEDPVYWIYQNYLTGEILSTDDPSGIFDENGNVVFPHLIVLDLNEQPIGRGGSTHYCSPQEYRMRLNGTNLTQDHSWYKSFDVRFDLTSQISKSYLMQCGFQFYHFDLRQWLGKGPEAVPRFQGGVAKPIHMNAYMNHKFEFRDMIANLGLSVQYFDPNMSWFDYVGENKFNKDNLDWHLFHIKETTDYWSFWYNMEHMWTRKAERKFYFSPRFGISHPVSVDGKLFLSHGIYRQIPDVRDMYLYSERHRTNVTYVRMGNPYVEFPISSVTEIGYQHNIANLFVIAITGYFKSVEKGLNRKEFYTINRDVDYMISVNERWHKMRGFEISMKKPFGSWLTGWLNYNYMVVTRGHYGLYKECEEPKESENRSFMPESPIPQPTARFSISLHTPVDFGPSLWKLKPIGGLKATLLGRYRGGGKTRLAYADPEDPTEPYVDVVDFHVFNGTLEKTLRVGSIDATFYLEVRNIFNTKHLNLAGMENKEEYQRSLHLPFEEGEQKGNDKIGDYEQDYTSLDPFWWSHFLNPRDYWFGVRFNFGI